MAKAKNKYHAVARHSKRAAIYVRVSSEKQAEKVSPQAQERDCRAYCEERGYVVVAVYRDIEKYRVNGRLVEPSGTRQDRPQLRKMLTEADGRAFDMIVAWREDRLYRGLRPMLDVIECIERNTIDIELAKETFDRKMAAIKASIAKMELDAIRERQNMGIAGRLAAGKVWNSGTPYGYRKVEDKLESVPEEAHWVRQIFAWYADGVGVRDIRWRLVEAGVPQKNRKSDSESYPWEHCVIYAILKHEFYATGIKTMRWNGQVYETLVPTIIDTDTWRRCVDRRTRQRCHPANHRKFDYLGMGIIYCAACEWKMSACTNVRYINGKPTETRYGHYACRLHQRGYAHKPGCPKTVSRSKLDSLLWQKIWELISNDAQFNALIVARVEVLQSQEADADSEVERLKRAIDELGLERQKVITWARKGSITDDDLEMQLGALTIQEAMFKRELSDKSLLVGNRAEQLIELANEVRARLREGAEWLNGTPETLESASKQFQLRRRIVEEIVKRVNVLPDKTIEVEFVLDLSGLVQNENTPASSLTAPSA